MKKIKLQIFGNAFNTLCVVIIASTITGIFLPLVSQIIEPYILLWLGLLLLFNLIKMNLSELYDVFLKPIHLVVLSLIKLFIIPITVLTVVTLLSWYLIPISADVKLSVFLLSGISTGLGSPFVINFVGGRLPLVVGMIITTSLSVPFVLPLLVFLFFRDHFSIPLLDMIILLMIALFIPLTLSQVLKKYFPRVTSFVSGNSQVFSLLFITLINVSVFGKYSNYFFTNPVITGENIILAFVLFGFFVLVGFLTGKIMRMKLDEIISVMIIMTYINNILVVVFAQQFFGVEVAALSAFFNFPYYVGILILKKSLRMKINS